MSEQGLLLAREDALRVILVQRLHLSYETARDIATTIVAGIDWNNAGLMNKSVEWITERYRKKNVPAAY